MGNTLLPPAFGCRDVGNEPKAAGNRSRDLGNGARAVQHGYWSIRNGPNQEWDQGTRNGLGTPGFMGRHKGSARMGPGLPEAAPRQLGMDPGLPGPDGNGSRAVGNGPQRPGIGLRNQELAQGCRKCAHGCRNGPKATGPGPGLPGMSAQGCRECARGCQNGPRLSD